MEARYHKAMERTALLESELASKAHLEIELQRVKDELRDALEELQVRARAAPRAPSPSAAPSTPVPSSAPAAPLMPAAPSTSGHDADELTLHDLVVRPRRPRASQLPTPRAEPRAADAAAGTGLHRLRAHMHQLQQRLQQAQTAPDTPVNEADAAARGPRHPLRSSLPRPRSSLSASWSTRPHTPATRAATPSDKASSGLEPARHRGTPGSSIPVPSAGLTRSTSRARAPSRPGDATPTPTRSVPYEFMEHDPAVSSPLSRSPSRHRAHAGTHHRPSSALRTSRTSPAKPAGAMWERSRTPTHAERPPPPWR